MQTSGTLGLAVGGRGMLHGSGKSGHVPKVGNTLGHGSGRYKGTYRCPAVQRLNRQWRVS